MARRVGRGMPRRHSGSVCGCTEARRPIFARLWLYRSEILRVATTEGNQAFRSVEQVAHADPHRIDGKPAFVDRAKDVVGRSETEGLVAEIEMQIFDSCGPVAGKAIFDTAAGCPSGAGRRVRPYITQRRRPSDGRNLPAGKGVVAPGESASPIEQPVVLHITQATAHSAECIDLLH